MSKNAKKFTGKVIDSKFSSDSVKTISNMKISTGAYGDLQRCQDFAQIEQQFKTKNGHHKSHSRHCKARRYRQNKFYKCKNRSILQHRTTCSHALKAKVCKTSPSLRQKSELESTANINSQCKSDGVNCSIRVGSGWKLKKVLNKFRCFSPKIFSDSNFSQVKIWNKSSERVGSSRSNQFSCYSWSSKKLMQKVSWRKSGSSSTDGVTDQSSKSVTEGSGTSNCSTWTDKTDDRKNRTLCTVLPAPKINEIQNSKSTETLKNSSFILGNSSEKASSIKINLRDYKPSLRSAKNSMSSFKNFSCAKLKHLKSAPALLKNLSCIDTSFVKVPSDKEMTKVTIVVDKTCQTTSEILDVEKVTKSTSCAFVSCPMFSDKEIQNEISLFCALNSSVNKMCQTQSIGSLLSEEKESDKCGNQTCEETLSEVNQLASELTEVAIQEQASDAAASVKQNGKNLSEQPAEIKVTSSSPKITSPVFENQVSHKCLCLHDYEQTEGEPGWLANKEDERTLGKCVTNQKCVSNPEYQNCGQGKHSFMGGRLSCDENSSRTPGSLCNGSNAGVINQKICTSIGFIQQPSVLKSSSSFLKVNFSRVDDPLVNFHNGYTCDIHKNPEMWKTKNSHCYDYPLTRSNFLKLYPEPYINHLSNNISNVQLIFHKKNKNQKQLYVCQECKKNASWNRHTRKHHLSPKWQKSASSCDSQSCLSMLDDCCSSPDTHSRPSVKSCSYHCRKNKQLDRKKIKLKRHENSESYEDTRIRKSKCGLYNNQRRMKDEDNASDLLNLPDPLPLKTSLQTATEVILPPPPPPLYAYPPYRYSIGEYSETYPQGKQISSSKRNKSPEYSRCGAHEQPSIVHEVLSPKQPQASPLFSRRHQSEKHAYPERVVSSNSENSDFIVIPNDRRYEKEKKVAGYFNSSKASYNLLKYPEFGDCIQPQSVKLKPKASPIDPETKVRKKIKDKYRRNGTSVRCLIREALTTERNSSYGKRNPFPEKFKCTTLKDSTKTEPNSKRKPSYETSVHNFLLGREPDGPKAATVSRKPVNKHEKMSTVQMSKNTFCDLSDSIATTSASTIKFFNFKNNQNRKIVKSESTQWPKPRSPAKEQVIKRYSEEFVRPRLVLSDQKGPNEVKEKETCELFRNFRAKSSSSSKHKSKLSETQTASNESIAQYFRLMDCIAEKRKQFKKEERRKLKLQELRQK